MTIAVVVAAAVVMMNLLVISNQMKDKVFLQINTFDPDLSQKFIPFSLSK